MTMFNALFNNIFIPQKTKSSTTYKGQQALDTEKKVLWKDYSDPAHRKKGKTIKHYTVS